MVGKFMCVCASVYSILRCDRSALYGGQRATERLTEPPSERAAETYSVPGISSSIQDANRRWLRGTTNKFGGGGSGVGYKISTSSTHPARFRSENSKLAHARMSERKKRKEKKKEKTISSIQFRCAMSALCGGCQRKNLLISATHAQTASEPKKI